MDPCPLRQFKPHATWVPYLNDLGLTEEPLKPGNTWYGPSALTRAPDLGMGGYPTLRQAERAMAYYIKAVMRCVVWTVEGETVPRNLAQEWARQPFAKKAGNKLLAGEMLLDEARWVRGGRGVSCQSARRHSTAQDSTAQDWLDCCMQAHSGAHPQALQQRQEQGRAIRR